MSYLFLTALPGNHLGDTITEVLGVVAVCAFAVVACYIALQVVKGSSKKSVPASGDLGELCRGGANKDESKKPKVAVDEKAELEKQCEALLIEILDKAGTKLDDFASLADDTFVQIAEGYASNSFGHEGETHAIRVKKFLSVCQRQWGPLRNDIGFMSNMDVQEHLRHILVNHRLLDGAKHASQEILDLSPEVLRSQELVALMRVVPRDKVRLIQEQLLDAVEDFQTGFEEGSKAWLNEQIARLNAEMRPRKSRKVQITDTPYHKRFKQLRVRLELVARLADGIVENTQRVSEAGLALSQVIHVGTVLRILATLPEWFTELGLGDPEKAELRAESV